jgi:hypothetical protein
MGSLSVHELKPTPNGGFAFSDLAELGRADIEDCYAVDMQFLREDRVVIINENGVLLDWHTGGGKVLR